MITSKIATNKEKKAQTWKLLATVSSGAFEVQKLGVQIFSEPWTSSIRYGKVDEAGLCELP